MVQLRHFDLRDIGTVQRLSTQGRALAYEPAASDGILPLREAMRAYVSAGYDKTVALIRRDQAAKELDAFGLMELIPAHSQQRARYASMLFMSPSPRTEDQLNAWAELMDMFVTIAMDLGALCIVAEVAEGSSEANALQRIGFNHLIHHDIMKLGALPVEMEAAEVIGLRSQQDADEAHIRLLSMRIVPKLIQKEEGTTDLTRLTHRIDCGFMLMRNQEPLANVSIRQGRRGYVMQPLFRPEAEDLAEPALRYILANLCDRNRKPVYCMVPTYQSWLLPVLDVLGFTHITSNAIMVKHTTARVRQPVWAIKAARANGNLIKSEIIADAQKQFSEYAPPAAPKA